VTDSAIADQPASEGPSRRALLGAGVIGAALAVAGGRPATATAVLPDSDRARAEFAIGLELAARDLYETAIAAGAEGPMWPTMRDQHSAYAERLAGISGISADFRNDAVYDALAGSFDTDDPAAAGQALENVAAATHTALIGIVTDRTLTAAMASIVSMESRHAAVLAWLAGNGDDFDALFLNSATAVSPES